MSQNSDIEADTMEDAAELMDGLFVSKETF